jgi:hypothetical protein
MFSPHSAAAMPARILAVSRPAACNGVIALCVEEIGVVVAEQLGFAVASAAMATLAAVFAALLIETAAPEPQVGPEGRVPVWVEQERESRGGDPSESRSAGAE